MRVSDTTQTLFEVLGADAALALMANFGGQEVYIPKRVNPHHWLTDAVGLSAASVLAERFGGGYIFLPKGQAAKLEERDRQIQQLYGKVAVRILCRRFNLSRRRILQIVAAGRRAKSESDARQQLCLFETLHSTGVSRDAAQ